MMRQSSEHFPPCSPAGRQEQMASPPWPQLHGTLLRQLRRAHYCIENLPSHQLQIPSCLVHCVFFHNSKNYTSPPRPRCKDMLRKSLWPFIFPQRPIHRVVARHSNCIDKVVILDQRALAFHQLVDQDRGYGVFACAGESVDPD